MQTATEPTIKSTQVSPKCPGCGATLSYSPEKSALTCGHCGNMVAIEASPARRFPLSELEQPIQPVWNEATVFSCNNCGAQEVIAQGDMAKACAFCGATAIVAKEELSGLQPNAVIPFKVSKESAMQRVVAWAKKKLFAPKRFKKHATSKDIDGVYMPAFTFDAQTSTRYRGVLSRVETFTTFINGRAVVQSRTVRFNISGTHSGNFNDIMIQACDSIAQSDLDKIQPFVNPQNVKDFNNAYLFGYAAGQHKRAGHACWNQARSIIESNIQKEVLSQHPGCSIVSFNANTVYNTASYRYMLLPVYVGHFNYREKLYQFFINGDSGKVTGKTPLSPIRVGLAALLGAIVLGGLITAIAFIL